MKLLSSRNKPTIDATLRPHDLSLSDSCYTNTHDWPPFAADILNVLLDFTSILYCFIVPRNLAWKCELFSFFFFSFFQSIMKRGEREREREMFNKEIKIMLVTLCNDEERKKWRNDSKDGYNRTHGRGPNQTLARYDPDCTGGSYQRRGQLSVASSSLSWEQKMASNSWLTVRTCAVSLH